MEIKLVMSITCRELAIRMIKLARKKFSEIDYKAIVALMADNELIEESEAVRLDYDDPEEIWSEV